MQIFIDTAEIDALRALAPTGLVDGVTTNPSLIAKSGRKIKEVLAEICALIPGPISGEVIATETDGMIAEGLDLANIAPNLVVKLPLTMEGLTACRALTERGVRTNVTLCFSAVQALLAAKAGASFISPFIGRLEDNGQDGAQLLHEIRTIYDRYGFETKILAASVRTPHHVLGAAMAGADCATLPPAVFRALYKHVLTDLGLDAFLRDWRATNQTIL